MRWSAVLLLVAACSAPAQFTQSAPDRPTELEARYLYDYFLVDVRIDGRGPYKLLLDTGASSTVLDSSIHKKSIERLEVGPLTVRNVPALEHDMTPFCTALGEHIDGILGYPVFHDVLLVLDYPTKTVRIAPGELPAADGREVVDLVGRGRPYLNLEFGEDRLTAVVDSGARTGAAIIPIRGLRWAHALRPVGSSLTIHGLVLRRAGRLATDVHFGPIVLKQPVLRETDTISHVGTKVLKHYRLTFDQHNRRVRFVGPPEVASEPIRGIGIALSPDGEVVAVFPSTPAASAGIRSGDRLTHVDGRPYGEAPRDSLSADEPRRRLRFEQAGEVTLDVVDLVP